MEDHEPEPDAPVEAEAVLAALPTLAALPRALPRRGRGAAAAMWLPAAEATDERAERGFKNAGEPRADKREEDGEYCDGAWRSTLKRMPILPVSDC